MAAPTAPLTPDEGAALTRLVMGFCLGKGSLCLYSRSYVLQISHPQDRYEYSRYQWRRLRQFLPSAREPKHNALPSPLRGKQTGQWRLRVSSRWFETAYRLLYPDQGPFRLCSGALELLGAEAIASLWADRGRVIHTRGRNFCHGRLNLSRYDFPGAQMVHDWIRTLTGASGRLHHGPYSREAPMIYYDDDDCQRLLRSLDRTWMAQAECLRHKFRLPDGGDGGGLREQLQREMLMPQVPERPLTPATLHPKRRAPRRVPGTPPRPLEPPVLNGPG